MLKAVLKKSREGVKSSKNQAEESTQNIFLTSHNGDFSNPCIQDDLYKMGFTKGVSVSLPSSPLLPRQSYGAQQRTPKKSPGSFQSQVEGRKSPRTHRTPIRIYR